MYFLYFLHLTTHFTVAMFSVSFINNHAASSSLLTAASYALRRSQLSFRAQVPHQRNSITVGLLHQLYPIFQGNALKPTQIHIWLSIYVHRCVIRTFFTVSTGANIAKQAMIFHGVGRTQNISSSKMSAYYCPPMTMQGRVVVCSSV